MPFVPIEKNGKGTWVPPNSAYFDSGSTNKYSFNWNNSDKCSALFAEHFDYIQCEDPLAKSFLRACGVKEEPTPAELALQVTRNPSKFLSSAGLDGYLGLLRQMASHLALLQQTRGLVDEMKRSAFLIAYKKGNSDEVQFKLAKASEIYLVDDTVLQQIFTPLSAPMETLLEEFYAQLGSGWLSKHVEETFVPKGTPTETPNSAGLQQLVRERAALLLYDGTKGRSKRDVVSDAEAILRSLQVRQVPQIHIVRKFLGKENKQATTACLMSEKRKLVLLIAPDIDYFDVAK